MRLNFQPFGDAAVRIQFGDTIDLRTHREIRRFASALNAQTPHGVTEWVSAYATLTVYYRPWQVRYESLCEQLTALVDMKISDVDLTPNLIEIPTLYGGKWGPDLVDVADYHGLTPQDVVEMHSAPEYVIYMLGFAPGFPYLGGLSEALATPRLATPRMRVAAGSVGIADKQTGIYPLETPGGWRIIGRTPLVLYDPLRESPVLFAAGDTLKFVPITEDEYRRRRIAHAAR